MGYRNETTFNHLKKTLSMSKEIKKVRSLMSRNIHYVDGMDTLDQVIPLIREKKLEFVLVKKRFEDDAIGIVVLKDIIRATFLADTTPDCVNVYEIMTKPVISIPADMDIRYAIRLMERAKLWLSPVEENGELIGYISYSDLLWEGEI